jgi:hypothetical protein
LLLDSYWGQPSVIYEAVQGTEEKCYNGKGRVREAASVNQGMAEEACRRKAKKESPDI